ncbi:MAG: hypothetical protein ACI8VE_000078 [Natrialbaceae archaeon]|jgi:hypothetical protein
MFIHWVWEMRRTDLSARIANVDWLDTDRQPEQPALCIEFDGAVDTLKDRFQGPGHRSYTPDDLDIFIDCSPRTTPPRPVAFLV